MMMAITVLLLLLLAGSSVFVARLRSVSRAASGSKYMLNSAAGVTLPGTAYVPPAMRNWPICPTIAGSRLRHMPTFVSGPSVTIVSCSAEVRIDSASTFSDGCR